VGVVGLAVVSAAPPTEDFHDPSLPPGLSRTYIPRQQLMVTLSVRFLHSRLCFLLGISWPISPLLRRLNCLDYHAAGVSPIHTGPGNPYGGSSRLFLFDCLVVTRKQSWASVARRDLFVWRYAVPPAGSRCLVRWNRACNMGGGRSRRGAARATAIAALGVVSVLRGAGASVCLLGRNSSWRLLSCCCLVVAPEFSARVCIPCRRPYPVSRTSDDL